MSWFDDFTSGVSDVFDSATDSVGGFFGGGSSTPTPTSSGGRGGNPYDYGYGSTDPAPMQEAEPNVSDNSGGGFFGGINDLFGSVTGFAQEASNTWFGLENLFSGDNGTPESEPAPDYRPQQPQTAIPSSAVGTSLGFIKDNAQVVMAVTAVLGVVLTFMMFKKG